MSETLTFKFDRCYFEFCGLQPNSLLRRFLDRHKANKLEKGDVDITLSLRNTEDGFELLWHQNGQKPLALRIEITKLITQLRSYPAPKQGAFNQALGKKTLSIIDATGGWGADTLLMCMQGYHVTVIERHPVMALMLREAMQRLAKTEWAQQGLMTVPTVIEANAVDYFNQERGVITADCVYLDPMFPPKKKKSAATNKHMQLLQWLLGQDDDAEQLVESALQSGAKRVSVKRPDYATPLYCKPSAQFSSKLVHYDVYLAN